MFVKRILDGSFLVNEHLRGNILFVAFCAFLAVLMIESLHRAEKKVYTIAKLESEVKALKGKYVSAGARLMKAKLESNIYRQVKETGLKKPNRAPQKIIVKNYPNAD
ncbi:MAG: FtsL-like putative cell division protein [Flavobacteriaceae bacterium]|nr:FtsL-like putative cell division protein [Flavobacteriaceae bacterium]